MTDAPASTHSDSRGEPAQRLEPGQASRALALDVLVQVLERGQPLDDVFERLAAQTAMESRDRAFARLMISTTLRRLGRLDAVVNAYLERPLPAKAAAARAILRLGAAQLLCLDTPPHAAVHAMTALTAARRDAQGFTRLVNAVLRKVSREGKPRFEALSAVEDWPAWLTDSWRAAHGDDKTQALSQACGAPAPLDLTVKDPATRDHWAGVLSAEAVGAATVRLASFSGDVTALAGFEEGAWWVQDAAAALPAQLLLAGQSVSPEFRVLDLCAAPGGKTMQLAAAGASVTALDRSGPRLKRLRRNLARTGLKANIRTGDGREALKLFADAPPFDAVLVDAPCTATGTLRRRPDVAWSKGPDDLTALFPVQRDLLIAATQLVRPGGRVVYCTCSLQADEGAPVLEAAHTQLERHKVAVAPEMLSEDAPLPDFATAIAPGAFRTFPTLTEDGKSAGGDGFFIALWRRSP